MATTRPSMLTATQTTTAPSATNTITAPSVTNTTTTTGNKSPFTSPTKAHRISPPSKPVVPGKNFANKKQDTWQKRIGAADYNHLWNTFNVFDEDKSGFIDPVEVTKALEAIGTQGKNPLVMGIITSLQQQNKPIDFQAFLEVVCTKVGDTKTREGIQRVFKIYDMNEDGQIDFEEFKHVAKWIKEGMNDDDLLEMLHSSFVMNHFQSNQYILFQQFYGVVVKFAAE